MKQLLLIIISISLLFSCNRTTPQKALPSDSIFHLQSNWQNQYGDTLKLNKLRGKTLVVVMIYTSCKAACPLLIADMKQIEKQIDPSNLNKVSLVLVSIDPETDTPEHLKEFAQTNKMDAAHWIFLRGNDVATKEFANVLSMKYKKISPIDFSHSNIISVFNSEGELVSQEEGTNINTEKVAKQVNSIAKTN
ncbi:MAG: SCO family protein [Chitinophagales bacterium]